MIAIKKTQGWEARLDAYIKSVKHRKRVLHIPVQQGDYDCGIFAMTAIREMTGHGVSCTAYQNALTYETITKNRDSFDEYISEIASIYELPEICPSQSTRGDVLIFGWNEKFKARAIGIRIGWFAAVPDVEHMGYIRCNLAEKAYRIR